MESNLDPVFLDTAYLNAIINTRDQWHSVAVKWEEKFSVERRQLITTEFVLLEMADGLAAVKFRQKAAQAIALLQTANQQVGFSSDLHFALGKLYCKSNLLDEAIRELEKTLEIQLDHQEAKLMLQMLRMQKRGLSE